jgi:hypothetical protein
MRSNRAGHCVARRAIRYSIVMIDVHSPHTTIGNMSEFFLHLFTITIGLLIAVGIEAAVEVHQHHELAAQARQTMTAEIRHNASSVASALADIEKEQKKFAQDLAILQKVQLNPKAPSNANLDISYDSTGLEDTAWRTAQVTGALSFMPYAEAAKFSDIYDAEQVFLKSQSRLAEDEAQMLGTIEEFHLGEGKMSEDAANAMAKQIGILQGHLLALKIASRLLQEEQDAFLQGRPAKHHLSESLTS